MTRDARRRLSPGDGLLVVLATGTFLLSAQALRTPAPHSLTQQPVAAVQPSSTPSPSASAAPAPGALVSAYGAFAVRWSGSCAGSATVGTSRDSGRTWTAATVPLAGLRSLTLGPGGAGTAHGCDDAAVTTVDGGRTWKAATADKSWRLGTDGEVLTPADAVPKADPCEEVGPGTASVVNGISATDAWVLCQRADGADRLLVRTRDGGATWQRLAGRRPETGLAGDGRVVAMRFTGRSVGVALVSTDRCASGDLRRTADGGAHWTPLPCVASLDRVLDASFADANLALAVGVSGSEVVTVRSSDSGQTWTRV